MTEITLTQEAIQLIQAVSKETSARFRDVVDEGDRLVFITENGQLGQALGKQAKNLKLMRELLKKDVKFVEYDADKQLFVRNLFKPFQLVSIRLETQGESGPEGEAEVPEGTKPRTRAIVEVEAEKKGKAIGKAGRNIASIRRIALRHHEIDEVIVL